MQMAKSAYASVRTALLLLALAAPAADAVNLRGAGTKFDQQIVSSNLTHKDVNSTFADKQKRVQKCELSACWDYRTDITNSPDIKYPKCYQQWNQCLETNGVVNRQGFGHIDTPGRRSQGQRYAEVAKAHVTHGAIAEVGLQYGFSALRFLLATPLTVHLYYFDNLQDDQTGIPRVAEILNEHFGNRITLIVGMSDVTLPVFRQQYPHEQFDLVVIDGGHNADAVRNDLTWFYKLGKPNCMVLMDDVDPAHARGQPYGPYAGPTQVYEQWLDSGRLVQMEAHPRPDGGFAVLHFKGN